MANKEDTALRQQEKILAKSMGDEARKFCHNFVGAIETAYVALDNFWDVNKRNVDCRLLLEQVLWNRRHPNEVAQVPELVRLAVDYAEDPTSERKRAIFAKLGFAEDEEVLCVANAPVELLRAELKRREAPGVVEHLFPVKGESEPYFRGRDEPMPFRPVKLCVSTAFAERLALDPDAELTIVIAEPLAYDPVAVEDAARAAPRDEGAASE